MRILEGFVQILLIENLSLNHALQTFLLCETNLDDSIASGNFSVRGYLSLIHKDPSIHVHGLAVYVKEGLSFAQDLPLENSLGSYLCFQISLSVLLLFPLSITLFVFVHGFLLYFI